MILPDLLELDQLEAKILQLEKAFIQLDPELDFRQFHLIQLQLSFYYPMVMNQNGDRVDLSEVRQSIMNTENLIILSYVREQNRSKVIS